MSTTPVKPGCMKCLTVSSPKQRHHHRSMDRIWPPALEVKLAQLSIDDTQQDNVQGYPSQHEPTHKHGYLSSSSSGVCTPCSCPSVHVIPAPPPLYHEDYEHDGDHEADYDIGHRTSPEDPRRERTSCVYPLSPSSALSGNHQKIDISAQYRKPIKSPRWFSGVASELKMTSCTTDEDEDKSLDAGEHNDHSNANAMGMNETEPRQSSQMTKKSYSPVVHSPPSPVSVSVTPGSLLYYSHYYSTPSSAASSPAVSRRTSLSSSPSMFMLQGFLASHSINGHIMFRKPPKCPPNSDCFTLGDGQCDNKLGLGLESDPGTEPQNEQGDQIEDDDEDDDLLDDRFLLLAQSPNSSDVDLGQELFVTERQATASLRQADSPVFFNGFPLMQMNR